MIRKSEPLNIAEASQYLKKDSEVAEFLKKFLILKPEKAKELKKNLEKLEIFKLNEKHIVKIIDIFPKDKDELNKILADVNLDEDETNKILNTIKEHK